MKRPLIGINQKLLRDGDTLYYKLDRAYVEAVRRTGGVPVLLPNFRTPAEARATLDRLDGFLFTGGADIDPKRWAQRRHPKTSTLEPEKEHSDFIVARAALARRAPVLGICYGHQLVNVVRGGSLHQHMADLPGVREHLQPVTTHGVEILGGTRTHDILGRPSMRVNSYHHQAVDRVGSGLRVTAYADDGILEGAEDPAMPFLVTIQWHPERMEAKDRVQRRLFAEFVHACRKS